MCYKRQYTIQTWDTINPFIALIIYRVLERRNLKLTSFASWSYICSEWHLSLLWCISVLSRIHLMKTVFTTYIEHTNCMAFLPTCKPSVIKFSMAVVLLLRLNAFPFNISQLEYLFGVLEQTTTMGHICC